MSSPKIGRCKMAIAAAVAIAASLALAPPASAQMTDPDQERARELVLRIRKSMREIDSLLLKGAQPEKVEQELAANQKRIEELLKETESKSQAVIQNIDELVKLTKYQKSNSGGSGGSQPPEQKPQGSEGQMPEREKSQDPQELSPQPKDGQQPKDGEQPKDEEQNRDGDPKSGRPDRTPPEQRDAKRPPPKGATGEFERTDVSGRWGMLPPKEAEDLQRRNADDFPQRYRQWMELYFRRVNKLPSR
jgi:hypothetical protein